MLDSLTAAPESKFAQTERWKLHYHEAGQGQALVLLHGAGPGATGWTNFAANFGPLAEHFRVVLLDLPGWGQSDPNDSLDMSRAAANATATRMLMDEIDIDKAIIVGNSMGGRAAQQFAVDYPDRISHLVMMGAPGAGPCFGVPSGPSEGLRILDQTYVDPSPENFRRLVEIMVYDRKFVTDELCEMRSRAALAAPEHLENWHKLKAAQLMATPDEIYGNLKGLAGLKIPSLIIHGRDDRVISVEQSLRLASTIPDARLLIFNRCGHWAQIEHANEFNMALTAFVRAN